MKKILLLGGSAQQVVAIETAKRLGYYTVLCDYLPDNPGQYHADVFHQVSTTDKEAVLKVAVNEKIDGILAYASDPAAPTAAYVAEKLGLPGNPYHTVETFCNKDLFREFLKTNGFSVPQDKSFGQNDDIIIDGLHFPLIVKPVDSSGSKGVTVIHDESELSAAVEYAFSYTRAHRIIIEEFIEKSHPFLVGGDIFVVDGKVRLWGLLNCHRDNGVNPLVPVGKSYPLDLLPEDEQLAKLTLQQLVSKSGFQTGAMNVELVIDQNHRCWLIDIGPRNGGNMIPDLLEYIFNINIIEMTIQAAMGEKIRQDEYCYATHNLHTNRNGIFSNVWFSPEIEQYIIRKNIYKKNGDPVRYFNNASDAIGIVFMKFPNQNVMHFYIDNINNYIHVDLKQENK